MSRPRLAWIDLAKVISICLVTSYHTQPPLTGYAAQLIQLLRMPAFFLIAGYLFDESRFSSLGALIRHRARQLLVPYLCFEALLIPLTCHSWADVCEASINALLGHPTTCYPLWFLVCLFGMQVTHYVCLRLTQRRVVLWLSYVAVATILAHCDVTHHFQLNALVMNLPFYAAANCAKPLVERADWCHRKTTTACLTGGLLVGLKYGYLQTGLSWTADALYYLTHLTAGLLLLPPYIASCKAVSRWLGQHHLITYLGSNTVVILALHTYFILALTHLTGDALLNAYGWLNPLLTLLVVVCHYPIIRAINRWTPWMLGRKAPHDTTHRTDAQ